MKLGMGNIFENFDDFSRGKLKRRIEITRQKIAISFLIFKTIVQIL
jgi:hypothetical protein